MVWDVADWDEGVLRTFSNPFRAAEMVPPDGQG